MDSWTGLLSKTVTSESVRGGCVTGHRRHGELSEPETGTLAGSDTATLWLSRIKF